MSTSEVLHRNIFILIFISSLLQKISCAVSDNIDYDFTGGTPCPKNNDVTGYDNLITLNQDMYLNALDILQKDEKPEEEYVYTLCPNTTYDITEASKIATLHEAIAIFLNNTIVRCGVDEEFHHGTCIVTGGNAQIVFTPVLETKNTVVKGITFTSNRGYGVAAYGHPASDATFIDCNWIENEAVYTVAIYYKPWESKSKKDDDDDGTRNLEEKSDYDEKIYYNTIMNTRFKHLLSIISSQQHSGSSSSNIRKSNNVSRRTLGYAAMTVEFIKCTFKDNVLSGEVINNQGGNLNLIETTFVSNIVKFAVIVVAYGGQLSIEQNTHFQENISPFVPIFVDNDSYLNLNIDNTGKLNSGQVCTEGIFLENMNSYCMEKGKCDGECCPFGDESCDRYMSPEDAAKEEMQVANAPVTNDIETASSSAVNDEEYKLNTFTAPESANVTDRDQSKTVTWLSILVGLLTSALVVMFGLYVFTKGRQHARLGLDPDGVLD